MIAAFKDLEGFNAFNGQEVWLSDCITRCDFNHSTGKGHIYICSPFPHVMVWVNDIHLKEFPTGYTSHYHITKLNYCLKGCCETKISSKKYVYMKEGDLSIDMNQAIDAYVYPTGYYLGFEIVFDNVILEDIPEALLAFGIDFKAVYEKLNKYNGSFMGSVAGEISQKIESYAKMLMEGQNDLYKLRIELVNLLFLLTRSKVNVSSQMQYLTAGQRRIAVTVEKRISENLRKRERIEDIAADYHISSSTLKKYFAMLYGESISDYVRRLRMELARELIENTDGAMIDIANECGYISQSKFGEVFKSVTGYSPMEYRRLKQTSYEKGEK